MSSRPTRDSGGGVLSFTFLDVLTCTMGSLVLLVVILGEKSADTRLEDALRNPRKSAELKDSDSSASSTDVTQSSKAMADTTIGGDQDVAQLAELQRQEEELNKLREKAKQRLAEEQARLAHLEDHERRLEHEIAKLNIKLELLQASEQKQTVDQDTAERELIRLRQLVADTEMQIQSLTMAGGKKTYAIVPYKGKHGTFRHPIYIECVGSQIIIQPEGVAFDVDSTDSWNGRVNPLAAAIRAAHEKLNERAVAAGEPDMPDAYPLFVVRPNGVTAFEKARAAIDTWDVEYGEEYVDADWQLHYANPDSELQSVMLHAVNLAVARQEQLARMAPRMYGGQSSASAAGPTKVVKLGEYGAEYAGVGDGDGSSREGQANGQWLGAPVKASQVGPVGGPQRRYGEAGAKGAGGGDFIDQFEPPEASTGVAGNQATPPPPNAVPGGSQSELVASNGFTNAMAGDPALKDPATAGGEFTGLSQPADENSRAVRAESRESASETRESAAKERGSNWANKEASRGAPISRPIHVIVRPDQLAVASTDDGGPAREPTIVSFHQPQDKVLNELAAAVRSQIKDWGFAGRGMYWRPTLALQVAPESMRQADQLKALLADSGIDVKIDEIAALPAVEAAHARR